MWPGFDSQTRRHMHVGWVCWLSTLLCSEVFFPRYSGFPLSSKTCIWFELISIYSVPISASGLEDLTLGYIKFLFFPFNMVLIYEANFPNQLSNVGFSIAESKYDIGVSVQKNYRWKVKWRIALLLTLRCWRMIENADKNRSVLLNTQTYFMPSKPKCLKLLWREFVFIAMILGAASHTYFPSLSLDNEDGNSESIKKSLSNKKGELYEVITFINNSIEFRMPLVIKVAWFENRFHKKFLVNHFQNVLSVGASSETAKLGSHIFR